MVKNLKTNKPLTEESSPIASLRIGDCLVKEGFATAEDIYKAVELQQKEAKRLKFSKENILPPLSRIPKKHIRMIFQQPPLDTNLGRICLQKGLLEKKDL